MANSSEAKVTQKYTCKMYVCSIILKVWTLLRTENKTCKLKWLQILCKFSRIDQVSILFIRWGGRDKIHLWWIHSSISTSTRHCPNCTQTTCWLAPTIIRAIKRVAPLPAHILHQVPLPQWQVSTKLYVSYLAYVVAICWLWSSHSSFSTST